MTISTCKLDKSNTYLNEVDGEVGEIRTQDFNSSFHSKESESVTVAYSSSTMSILLTNVIMRMPTELIIMIERFMTYTTAERSSASLPSKLSITRAQA